MRGARLIALYDRLLTACAVVVGLLILSTVFLVTVDVVSRYFFSAPLGWVFELTEHILVCVPFLGMAWLVRGSGHVRIEIVVQTLPPLWQTRFTILAYVLSGLTCAAATYYATATTFDHYARGIVTYGIYPIPKFILIAIIAFGLALTTIEFFRRATAKGRA